MKVLHLIRKESQLKASFIHNQVNSHVRYSPYIAFRTKRHQTNDGGFVENENTKHLTLNLQENETYYDKLIYKIFKRITHHQVKMVEQFIIDNQINIIHLHYGTDAGIYYPLIKKSILPSIVSFYGYDCSGFPKKFMGFGRVWLKQRVFNLADKITAMSEDMESDLLKIGCPREKIIVHYHGSDIKIFKAIERNKKPNKTEKVVLLILCSLVPKKGHMFLLDAIKEIVQSNETNFILRIVGSGEMEAEIKAYISSHDLQEYINLSRAIPYGKVAMINEYTNADIFIHPSVIGPDGDKEGIPGAIIEAMASGLPVISTNHAGIPYVIENEKTGMLVNEWDVPGLTAAIKKILADSSLRVSLGERARDYVSQNLELSVKEAELELIYDNVIKEYKVTNNKNQ